MSYIIPTNELTLTDIRGFRSAAVEAGIAAATPPKGAIASSREGLIVRAGQQIADFLQAATQEFWQTPALAVLGNPYSVFGASATPQLGNNKLAIFYKAGIETAPSPVSLLSFRQGATAGTTKAVFDLEQLVTKMEVEGYFTEPVVFLPQAVMNIVVTCRIVTNLLARVPLGVFIVEPVQQTIS